MAVAQGGMGTVWAARLHGSPAGAKIVAVKTMLPALSSDPRFERMFLAEAHIASRIQHPNVCAIVDQGEQDGVLYLVMEWIDGDSLVALLRGSGGHPQGAPLPLPVAVRIGIDAARGLHAAHELRDDAGALFGVVHRDVSPHNILVSRDGAVKIADFGVAKAMAHTDNPTTTTGQMKGKIHFMAPEQVCGEPLDRRTDIFALGIVLYQLSTGAHPFAAQHDMATMAKVARPEPVDAPSTVVPGYPPDLEATVMKALAKDPAERFATMADLAAALVAVEARLGGRREEVTAYVRAALADRTARRAAMIQEALRAADGKTPAKATLRRDRGGRERRGRKIATAAALVAAGALLGAASLLWLGAGDPREPTPTPLPEAAPPWPEGSQGAPATADTPDTPPVESELDAGSPPPDASASSPSASAGAPGAPSPQPRPDAGRALFRDPGF